MKTGRTPNELAAEVMRQAQTKKDYIAKTSALEMILEAQAEGISIDSVIAETERRGQDTVITAPDPARRLMLSLGAIGSFPLSNLAHEQIATLCGIPKAYYDRMKADAPDLIPVNVNRWLQTKGQGRMVRTLDGTVRAVLSDRYRPMDNLDLMLACLPALQAANAVIRSCEVTENRLYIKATAPELTFKVKLAEGHARVNDVIEAGILIQNSEVGLGRLTVVPWTLVQWCSNGATHEEYGTKRTHIGGRKLTDGDSGEIPEEWLKDETRAADDAALWLKVRDVVAGSFDRQKFEVLAGKLQAATGREMDADPLRVTEVVRKNYGLTEDEKGAMLKHLISGADLTQYGLGQAITRTAEDAATYDRASELERIGGTDVLEMPASDWQRLISEASKVTVN